MNAKENSSKSNARLNRIKTVSRNVKFVLLAFFVFTVGYLLIRLVMWTPLPARVDAGRFTFGILMEIVLCVWYWKLAKLFHYYELGFIFSSETILCIKTLGLLCASNWLFASTSHIFFPPPSPLPQVALPPGVEVHLIKSSFNMTFFSFSIAGINFGLLLAGAIIVIIAWIMDEGRKIQEEQELTV